MFTRFSRTVSRPLVVSFFTQRHPQAKSSITEKMAEWMEDNHVLAEISKSSRNPFLSSSHRFPIPSEIQENGLSGKKGKY